MAKAGNYGIKSDLFLILIQYLLLIFGVVESNCPHPTFRLDPLGNCYYISTGSMLNWTDARAACQRMKGDLLTINSRLEENTVAWSLRYLHTGNLSDNWERRWWTGLHMNGLEWHWPDGTRADIEKLLWRSNQPDNRDGVEDCGGFWQVLFNDEKCRRRSHYICEIPSEPESSDGMSASNSTAKLTTVTAVTERQESEDLTKLILYGAIAGIAVLAVALIIVAVCLTVRITHLKKLGTRNEGESSEVNICTSPGEMTPRMMATERQPAPSLPPRRMEAKTSLNQQSARVYAEDCSDDSERYERLQPLHHYLHIK